MQTEHTPYDSALFTGPRDGFAQVTGVIPDWLRGRLVRTAPAVFQHGQWQARTWFDALGMLYSFSVERDGRVSWMQRMLDCGVTRAVLAGQGPAYSTFGSGNQRSFLRRLVQPAATATDNTNVHIVPMGDEWVAMSETNQQLAIDPTTLETRGRVAYQDNLPTMRVMTAHPHFDFERNLVVNVGMVFSAWPELVVYSHAPGSRRREALARVRVRRIPYVHSFGLSREKVVLVGQPFDVNPVCLLWSNDFIEHYRWNPEQGTRLFVIDRSSGAVEEFETDPLFVFHTVNTFQDGSDLVLDALVHQDARIVEQVRIDQMAQSFPCLPSLVRIRMTPGVPRARIERLSDVRFELPQVNYRAKGGLRHRYVWGAPWPTSHHAIPASTHDAGKRATSAWDGSAIIRLDMEQGEVLRFSSDGFVFGEPLFVSAPTPTSEDHGVLVAVGSHPGQRVSKLVVLDARDLQPLAEATVPVPLPFGFHGTFERDLAAT